MKLHDSGPHAADSVSPETVPAPTAVELSLPGTRTVEQLEQDEPSDPVSEYEERVLRPDDFVFLSGKGTCRLIRTREIWLLEACGGRTRVSIPGGTVVLRRTLAECERKLDRTAFFRATRDCIINLMHVKQTRLLDCSRVAFVLPNNKQVIVSGEQNAFFRKMRAL
jgi:DNA-binding LytR/AlgR family response regulator